MKKLFIICLVALMGAACSSSISDAEKVDFITTMYNGELYQSYEWLEAHCTQSCLDYLQSQYDYDCDEGPCYAVWMFRTQHQDGDGESRIVSVTPIDSEWFEYRFLDMGHEGVNRIRLISVDHQLRIDEIVQL